MTISDPRGRPILLDTHIWIWSSGSCGGTAQFAAHLASVIEEAAENRYLFVSAASIWEIALKTKKGETLIAGDLLTWVKEQSRHPGVQVLPITSSVAAGCTEIPLWVRKDKSEHRDPADRFLVTTSRLRAAVLITCDEQILNYAKQGHVLACDARI